jgi:hypothetical protein
MADQVFGPQTQERQLSWEKDPENPQNWSNLKKTLNLGIVSILAFITYVIVITLHSEVVLIFLVP